MMRVRQVAWFVLVFALGYALGYGAFSEWIVDLWHMVGVEWARTRDSRGSNGALPLLIAGFLIGQGLFLLAKRIGASVGPMRARAAEKLAAWDPALNLPRRFGLQRYLEYSSRWAKEDPTARMQSLALFKLHGLGELNDKHGTHVTTQLLQRVAAEVRAAALPRSASRFARWCVRHMPRQIAIARSGLPRPRYAARWSGSTFALAFRELDMLEAISISRHLSAWMRAELSAIEAPTGVYLSAGIAVGCSRVSARALAAAAATSLAHDGSAILKVVYDPSDVRAETISQMPDIARAAIDMRAQEDDSSTGAAADYGHFRAWLRHWGPPIGCFAAAVLVVVLSGSREIQGPGRYPWPDALSQVQVVDQSGPKPIRIVRQHFADVANGDWALSDVTLAQGNVADGPLPQCQFHVTIRNGTSRSQYVSTFDFEAIDTKGRRVPIDPTRMLRLPDGLSGRWLKPGEAWSAWALLVRRDAAIDKLVFEPERSTRFVLVAESRSDVQ